MITERFLYEIHPHRPIKNLIPGRAIIKPCSMKLTKEEVLTCMQSGPVFRAFPGKDLIRVTGSNLDQLHTDKFVGEKISTSEANHTPKAENVTRAQDPSPEEPKTEAPREEVVEEKQVHVETTETENEDGTYTYDTVFVEAPKEETTVEQAITVAAPNDGLVIEDAPAETEESTEEIEATEDEEEEVLEETEDEVEETTEGSVIQNNTPHVNIHSSKKYYNNKKRH